MNRAERIYRLHTLLQRKPHPLAKLMEELLASKATVKRDIAYMRDFMAAPIAWNRERNGYHYDPTAPAFELPGLWLNESELFALLASERLLEQIQPGVLAPYIGPLRGRIRSLLAQSGHSANTVSERILLQPAAARSSHPERFGHIAGALLNGRKLNIRYHGHSTDSETRRSIHPQRLLHYRDPIRDAERRWQPGPEIQVSGYARFMTVG